MELSDLGNIALGMVGAGVLVLIGTIFKRFLPAKPPMEHEPDPEEVQPNIPPPGEVTEEQKEQIDEEVSHSSDIDLVNEFRRRRDRDR
jgi:hypothetical protein